MSPCAARERVTYVREDLASETERRMTSRRSKATSMPASFAAGKRRFLMRSFPPVGSLSVQWRDGGFAVGPRD